jgi:hypothetical protein
MIDYSKAQIPVYLDTKIEHITDNVFVQAKNQPTQLLTCKFNFNSTSSGLLIHQDYKSFLEQKSKWTRGQLNKLLSDNRWDIVRQDMTSSDFPKKLNINNCIRPEVDIIRILDTNDNRITVIADPNELARAFFAALHQDGMVEIDYDLDNLKPKISLIRPTDRPKSSPQTTKPLQLGG